MGLLEKNCWPRIIGWVASVLLFLVFLKCANFTAYNWWAAGFRDNPNAAAYQRAGNWYFAGAIASLVGSVAFVIVTISMTLRRKRGRQITGDKS